MEFKILLVQGASNESKDQNWVLRNRYTIQYNCNSFDSIATSDSVRRDASKIYKFLLNFNSSLSKKDKITSIIVERGKYSGEYKGFPEGIYRCFLEGLHLCNYEFNRHKTNHKTTKLNIRSTIEKVSEAAILGNHIARDLVNEPLSHLTAVKLSSTIKKLGKEAGFGVEVLDEKRIKSLKMGGLLSVNKGSVAKPTFNILTYKSKKSTTKTPVVLVGKGVMYDTGGLSLKPTPNSMDMMKCDMAGGAAVIGAIYALAKAKVDCYIVGLIPAVENRPGGEAYVPGDVITMMDGTTVEVLNTDAEGRLILADALHYAKRYNPELVIDLATLTGSAARLVGKYGIVAMEQDSDQHKKSKIMKTLVMAGYISGERIAIQPFWDDYKDELKSSIADIKNLGGAEAGHITAGKFLEYFVDYPWIHLDIAGGAFLKEDYLYHPKGGTGIGVRLLVEFFIYQKDLDTCF